MIKERTYKKPWVGKAKYWILLFISFLIISYLIIRREIRLESLSQQRAAEMDTINIIDNQRFWGEIPLNVLMREIKKSNLNVEVRQRKQRISIITRQINEKIYRQIYFNYRDVQSWTKYDPRIKSIIIDTRKDFGVSLNMRISGRDTLVSLPWEIIYSLAKYNGR